MEPKILNEADVDELFNFIGNFLEISKRFGGTGNHPTSEENSVELLILHSGKIKELLTQKLNLFNRNKP